MEDCGKCKRSTYRGRPTRRVLITSKLESKLEAAHDAAWHPMNFMACIRETVAVALSR